MIRRTRLFVDIQDCIVALLNTKTASPWTRWNIICGYPNETVFENFSKPFIFVSEPTIDSKMKIQGAAQKNYSLDLRLGAWVGLDNGGQEELNIMSSEILNFLDDNYTCNTTKFSITIGTTNYSDKTTKDMGFYITDILTGRFIPYPEDSQLRQDFSIKIKTALT